MTFKVEYVYVHFFFKFLNVLFVSKVNCQKNPVLSIKKFPSLVLPWNAMLQRLIIQFLSITCHASGRLREVKYKRKRLFAMRIEFLWLSSRGIQLISTVQHGMHVL